MNNIVIVAMALAFSVAGCNEEKPAAQTQLQQKQAQQAAEFNDAVGKSIAPPAVVIPEKGKYKW